MLKLSNQYGAQNFRKALGYLSKLADLTWERL